MKYCFICKNQIKMGKYCSEECKEIRRKETVRKMTETVRRQFANGRKSWIDGKTKETEPILQKVALDNVQRTKEQYARTGKEKWLADRPGFIRTGRKNSEYQKQKTRAAMLWTIFNNKITHKKSVNELKIVQMLKDVGYIVQDVLVEGVCLPDCFLPDLNAFFFYDGPYYHEKPKRIETDERQTKQLLQMGFNVIRMNEKQFNLLSGNLEKLRQFIKENTQTQV